jgi:hypothetical protein
LIGEISNTVSKGRLRAAPIRILKELPSLAGRFERGIGGNRPCPLCSLSLKRHAGRSLHELTDDLTGVIVSTIVKVLTTDT